MSWMIRRAMNVVASDVDIDMLPFFVHNFPVCSIIVRNAGPQYMDVVHAKITSH